MIKTERLHIIPLSYEQLISRVYSRSGMINNQEEEDNVVEFSLKPMKNAPEHLHKWYTFWLAYYEGEEVLECGFLCPPTVHNVVEVFCYTRPEFQKRGFGTEAIKGLVKFATAFNDISYVCASVAKDNLPSQKMFLKNGFEYLTEMKNGMNVYNLTIKN
ncbi:MAG: GNAT family N-acetyltransferase [Bacteroidota bacterium]